MRKILMLVPLAICTAFLFAVTSVSAAPGACSGHGGVNCSAGPDVDGSAICVDGWKGSSVQYNTLVDVCAADYVDQVFTDLFENHKNAEAIEYLKGEGVIGGYPDGSFQPDREINRAELLKVLVEGVSQSPDVNNYNNCFSDVQDQWFAPYICYAKSVEWVEGYPDGSYKPDQTVNKVEALKMLLNSQKVDVPSSVDVNPFDDVAVDQWFAPYVKIAKDLGILEETGSVLNPGEKMKRASVSENLYRLLKYLDSDSSVADVVSEPEASESAGATNDEIIQAHCSKDWEGDADMMKFCTDQQNEALKELAEAAPEYVMAEKFDVIKKKCADEWVGDFKMEAFCRDQQYERVKALQEPKPDYVGDEQYKVIVEGCESDWSDDYKMQDFCRGQQFDAVKTLNESPASAACVSDWPKDYKMQVFCMEQG